MRFTYTFADGRQQDLVVRVRRKEVMAYGMDYEAIEATCHKWLMHQDEIEEIHFDEVEAVGDLLQSIFLGLELADYEDFENGNFLGISWIRG